MDPGDWAIQEKFSINAFVHINMSNGNKVPFVNTCVLVHVALGERENINSKTPEIYLLFM